MGEDLSDKLIERLITALASQVAVSDPRALTAKAIEALGELSRAEARVFFGSAGHLVHYGSETHELEALIESISNIQRMETDADAALAPGDMVRLVGELPRELNGYDSTWLSETTFVVRYVGPDATVDVQPTLIEDFVIETVPTENLRPTS